MTRREIQAQLMEEYAQLRRRCERERDDRVEEIRASVPGAAALMEQNANLFVDSTRKMIENRESAQVIAQKMRAQAEKIQAALTRTLLQSGYPADYLKVQRRCPICDDYGYTGPLKNTPCPCFTQRLMARLYADNNLTGLDEQNFDKFNIDLFSEMPLPGKTFSPRDIMRRARFACEQYADRFPDTPKSNLLLMGQAGLGKSFLLNCVAERVIARNHTALRVTAFRMVEAMRKHHYGAEESPDALDEMINCEFLIVDDLGTEPVVRNVTVEYLFTLLNERMGAKRHTAIATNLSMKDLQERYNERVASRLLDVTRTDILILYGDDLRQRRA